MRHYLVINTARITTPERYENAFDDIPRAWGESSCQRMPKWISYNTLNATEGKREAFMIAIAIFTLVVAISSWWPFTKNHTYIKDEVKSPTRQEQSRRHANSMWRRNTDIYEMRRRLRILLESKWCRQIISSRKDDVGASRAYCALKIEKYRSIGWYRCNIIAIKIRLWCHRTPIEIYAMAPTLRSILSPEARAHCNQYLMKWRK